MFPLYELLSHAELSRSRNTNPQAVEARRAARHSRCGNLTLFPLVERPEPIDPLDDEPTVIASISNVSATGLGLLHSDEMPMGLEFDVRWREGNRTLPLRFQVVHSRPTAAGMYRTGAQLISGQMPEQAAPTEFQRLALPAPPETSPIETAHPETSPAEAALTQAAVESALQASDQIQALAEAAFAALNAHQQIEGDSGTQTEVQSDLAAPATGIMQIQTDSSPRLAAPANTPTGTFSIRDAAGFDKTECLDGVTTCGWERSVEMRRAGQRLWIYIHSPGKKNGWGIFVDQAEFESAFLRVQEAAKSPFISTLAA